MALLPSMGLLLSIGSPQQPILSRHCGGVLGECVEVSRTWGTEKRATSEIVSVALPKSPLPPMQARACLKTPPPTLDYQL